jgi:hypothetical protein
MVTKVHHIDSLPTSHSELQNPTLVHSKPHPPHTLPTTTTNLITQRKQTIEISNTAGLFTKMSTRLQPKQTLSSTDIPHWGSNSGESVTTPDELHPATPPPPRTEPVRVTNVTEKGYWLPALQDILPPPQPCPVKVQTAPNWLIPEIASIVAEEPPPLQKSPLLFEVSKEAAFHNQGILAFYNYDLNLLLQAMSDTCLRHGSEFRDPNALQHLLQRHPRWQKFCELLREGSRWPLLQIADKDRVAKNKELVTRGNHKSAVVHGTALLDIINKEVAQGWMIPIPTDAIPLIKNSEVAPVGIDEQWQAYEDGTRAQKFRLTHDQSFEASVGQSVNSRVIPEQLDELYYGHCLSRILHYLVSTRKTLPSVRLYIGKTDFKGAYRRVTLNGDIAPRCIIVADEMAFMSTRLTFGGSPGPNEFCVVSELCADLGNDILHSDNWDPKAVHSPHTIKLPLGKPSKQEPHLTKGEELDVEIPFDPRGRIEVYIDDGIIVVPDIEDNLLRGTNAMALAIHTICRPVSPKEPLIREDCLSLSKLTEEGTLSESSTVLGWTLDTRHLTVSLPLDKFNIWQKSILETLERRQISSADLATLIGRLNHAASVLPLARYFLNRLRAVLPIQKMSSNNHPSKHRIHRLPMPALEDLQLFYDTFLPKIHEGISMNLLTHRRPTHLLFSDACPKGLGGYSAVSGRAWRWQVPEEFLSSVRSMNNLLEFLAALTTIWLELEAPSTPKLSCLLALGDNTSAVGWLHKANVDPAKNIALQVATRKLATLLMEADCCIYSQHFRGVFNNTADVLSRRHDLTDVDITAFILSHYHDQVPASFQVVPLPDYITCWMTWLLQKNRELWEFREGQQRKRKGCGDAGNSTFKESTTPTTYTCKTSNPSCRSESSEPLEQLSDEGTFPEKIRMVWAAAQLKRPWQSWARCLGQTWGSTPTMAQMDKRPTHSYHVR